MNKIKQYSIKSNLGHNVILTIISLFIPVLLLGLISRSLGVDKYGIYATVLSYSLIYVVFTEFGLMMSLTRFVSISKGDLHCISELYSSYIIIRTISCALTAPLFIVFFKLYVANDILLSTLAYIYYIAMSLNFSWVFQGAEIVRTYSKDVVISKLIFVGLVMICAFQGRSLEYYIGAQTISSAILVILNTLKIKCIGVNFRLVHWQITKKILVDSLGFYLSRLTVNLYESCSTFLASRFLTSIETGQYSMALQFFKAGGGVIGAVSMSLYPYVNRTKNFKLLVFIAMLMIVLLALCSPLIDFFYIPLVNLLFGEGYGSTLALIKVFYFASMCQVVSSIFGYPVLSAINKTNVAHWTIIFGSLTYFITMILFIITSNLTVLNMAHSIAITMGVLALMRILYCLMHYRKQRRIV